MRAILLTLLLSGCASFEDTALDAKWRMTYVAHSPKVSEQEPLSAAKGWEGDCSNLAYYMKQQHSETKILWGQIFDGRMHMIACKDKVCVDTMHKGLFNNYPELWKIQPIEI